MNDQATAHPKVTLELVITILLAVAAVATAWSSYQANRWNGEQAKAAGRTNGLRVEAARAQGLSEAQQQVDVATFVQWVDAYVANDPRLQDFYLTRFRPEFRTAFDAWIATKPFEDPSAPLTPFAVPEYELASKEEAAKLDAAAEASAASVQAYIQRSSNYVLAVVLFAAVLFFAGISTKLRERRSQLVLVGIAVVLFLGAVGWIATFPVTVSI